MLVKAMLAAAAPDNSQSTAFTELLPWLALLLGIVVVGMIVLGVLRRYVRGSQTSQTMGFSLADLRTLHESGELTDEEFQRAKDAMIGQLGGREPSENPPRT